MSAKRRGRANNIDPRDKSLTWRYVSGELEAQLPDVNQPFSKRSVVAQERRIQKTALMRAAEADVEVNPETLPIGQVCQVYSLYQDVEFDGVMRLCVVRKTLGRLMDSAIVVGDQVRFRDTPNRDEQGRLEAVIEAVLPRRSVLTRADSFNPLQQHPIVANAQQMLIVVSLLWPEVRWGLVDRMIVAAQAGGLRPIVCLNKVDMAVSDPKGPAAMELADAMIAYYRTLDITCICTSVIAREGLDELQQLLAGQVTVLAGHSGVGKSSLIRALQPLLDIRVGAISGYSGKGRHTTSSARRYKLDFGGELIDTPGVKLFGLWNVTGDTLADHFPDIADDTAPDWRRQSFDRILKSLSGDPYDMSDL